MCVYSNLSKNHEVEVKQEGGGEDRSNKTKPPQATIFVISLSQALHLPLKNPPMKSLARSRTPRHEKGMEIKGL